MRRSIIAPAVLTATLLVTGLGVGVASAQEDPASPISLPTEITDVEVPSLPTSKVDAPVGLPTGIPTTGLPTTSVPTTGTPSSTPAPSSTGTPTTTSGLPTTTVANPEPEGNGTITVAANTAPSNTPLGGVSATVTDCLEGGLVATLTTQANGTVSQAVPYGCYIISLAGYPADYVSVGNDSYGRNVTADQPATTALFEFESGPAQGLTDGILVKKDRLTGATLSRATYEVSSCADDNVDWHRVSTADDGTARLALAAGCHKAIEIVAPEGYVLDQSPIYFDVVEGHGYSVSALDTPVGYQPVNRNVGSRTPLQSIPSGPITKP